MSTNEKYNKKRLNLDGVIQRYFGSTALVAIVVLVLITIFLFREGAGFFPQNLKSLRVYRLAGLEYVDVIKGQINVHAALNRSLQAVRSQQFTDLLKANGENIEAANAQLAQFDQFANDFDSAIDGLRSLSSDLTDIAASIKDRAKIQDDAVEQRRFLLEAGRTDEANEVKIAEIDFKTEVKPITASFDAYLAASLEYREKITRLLSLVPKLPLSTGESRFTRFQKGVNDYLGTFHAAEAKLRDWDQLKPIPWYAGITSFIFGKDWITNSFWQDFYGMLPLLTGSLLVAGIALLIAVPLGVCAAVYVSEVAKPTEANLIKPYIEFIAAIPSVVLGFFGIVVLGETIRQFTNIPMLSWLPGFPIAERLNSFTAGCLLALMAVPTIFSLSEDALNSVPRAFKEASYALGATKFQTIIKILIPASLSGIISAILLGFGRVIGETMVVLLCAGNRIEIPDFTLGVASLFQPVHTMTGIVAQEFSEVVRGSIHYRALFIVGLVLFLISLLVNGPPLNCDDAIEWL